MNDRDLSRIFVDECKGRARNVGESFDPCPGRQSLDQVSLSCSQFTDKGNHVPWPEETTDSFTQFNGFTVAVGSYPHVVHAKKDLASASTGKCPVTPAL